MRVGGWRLIDGQGGFGCRILTGFKGAGFDFSFPAGWEPFLCSGRPSGRCICRDAPDSYELPKPLFDFFLQQVDKYAGASDATLQRLRYLREAVLLRAWTPQQAAQDALNRRDALASAPEEDRAAFYRFAMDIRSETAL